MKLHGTNTYFIYFILIYSFLKSINNFLACSTQFKIELIRFCDLLFIVYLVNESWKRNKKNAIICDYKVQISLKFKKKLLKTEIL